VITDGGGCRIGFHHYFPFGEEWTTASGAQEGEVMKFTGHERDIDAANGSTPLDYMHARYYSGTLGRFLQTDIVLSGGSTLTGWNRYSYVDNRPISVVDPSGWWECDATGCRDSITVVPIGGTDSDYDYSEFLRESANWAQNLRYLRPGDFINRDATVHGLEAFVDGVVPDIPYCDSDVCKAISDPFEANGYYDVNDPGMSFAQGAGVVTRDVEIALLTAGVTMETRGGAEGGNWVTNNVFRWGKGSWKGSGGPRWHAHVGPRRFMGHHLPWQARTWRTHVTKEIMRSLGIRW